VGLVHLGILILVEVDGREVSIKESDKFSLPEWFSLDELKDVENLEGWSRLVVDSGLVV
jgi:predicted NUDIX family phosphoesterase